MWRKKDQKHTRSTVRQAMGIILKEINFGGSRIFKFCNSIPEITWKNSVDRLAVWTGFLRGLRHIPVYIIQ